MDTLGQFIADFEARYLAVAGTAADPYKDVPEFDDYMDEGFDYDGYGIDAAEAFAW